MHPFHPLGWSNRFYHISLNLLDLVCLRRIAFVAYNILMQVFALYVRIRAKQINDRTPLIIESGISTLVKSQMSAAVGGDVGSNIVKSLANRFLSSQTTVVEYDVKQSDNMRNSYVFSLVFMWVLHFKFKQVQPLFLTVASGLLQWVQSPLFQVYILDRNLQRPFRPAGPRSLPDSQDSTIGISETVSVSSDQDDYDVEYDEDSISNERDEVEAVDKVVVDEAQVDEDNASIDEDNASIDEDNDSIDEDNDSDEDNE